MKQDFCNKRKGQEEEEIPLFDVDTLELERKQPKEEKIRTILEQLKNPYLFRSGSTIIEILYEKQGESLQNMLIKLACKK